jgi:hypothetical protein
LIIVLIFKNSVNMVSKIILQLGMFSKLTLLNLLQNKSLSLHGGMLMSKKRYQNCVSGSKIRLYADSQSLCPIFETHTYPVGIS